MQGLYVVISQGGDDGHLHSSTVMMSVWHLQIWGSVAVAASRAGGASDTCRSLQTSVPVWHVNM
jgi:hypothetical protein